MPSFERHARTVTLFTIVSRVTGLARDAVLSRLFGAGPLMSAFFFAFMIPNLFRRLFGEGALAAAFLPGYARLEGDDRQQAAAYATLTLAWMVVILGALTMAGEFGLMMVLTLGHESNMAVRLLMIMLPYMPLVCVVAILGAMLQVRGRFGPTAAAPIVLNVCLVAAALGFAGGFHPAEAREQAAHITVVAAAVVLAGVLQVAWSLWALRKRRWWTSQTSPARPEVKKMMLMAGPMILSLGVLQLNTFFDGVIASYPVTFGTTTLFGLAYPLDESAMAMVGFGQRLYQFPLGVFGIAVATAIFPQLAREAADDATFLATLRRGLRLVVFIGLPASVGLMLVRQPLIAVVYQGGEFTAEHGRRVANVVLGYAPAIWAYSMIHVLTRAYYARGDSRGPVRIALGIVGLNLVLNCLLIWTPLREAGLAWSTAICALVQVIALLALFRRHAPGAIDPSVIRSWRLSAILTVVMAGVVLAILSLMPDVDASWGKSLAALAILSGAGMIVVGGLALALRMPEVFWALGLRGRGKS